MTHADEVAHRFSCPIKGPNLVQFQISLSPFKNPSIRLSFTCRLSNILRNNFSNHGKNLIALGKIKLF